MNIAKEWEKKLCGETLRLVIYSSLHQLIVYGCALPFCDLHLLKKNLGVDCMFLHANQIWVCLQPRQVPVVMSADFLDEACEKQN